MKKGGIGGGFEAKQDFHGNRRTQTASLCCHVCVCNDPSSVEGAIDFAKRNLPSQALGRTTHVWLPHVCGVFGPAFSNGLGGFRGPVGFGISFERPSSKRRARGFRWSDRIAR